MLIERISGFTGKTHTMDIPVTVDQIKAWEDGELIQNVMPNLTPDQREFIMTGVTPEEWENVFGEKHGD